MSSGLRNNQTKVIELENKIKSLKFQSEVDKKQILNLKTKNSNYEKLYEDMQIKHEKQKT